MRVLPESALLDAGHDSGADHAFAREALGAARIGRCCRDLRLMALAPNVMILAAEAWLSTAPT